MEEDVIRNIQRNFREVYPHLKLQFYKNPHMHGSPSPAGEKLSPLLAIEEVTMVHTSGKVNIDPDRTVAQVEYDFFRNLGLCVQVFRQSGDMWLETTDTDDWTLQRQEQRAIESLEHPHWHETEDFGLGDVG